MTTEKKTSIKLGCSSFTNLLTAAFIVLKIVGVEPIKDWNWLLVFSPTLILFGIALLIAMVWAAIIMGIMKNDYQRRIHSRRHD